MRLLPPILLVALTACGNPDGGLTVSYDDEEPTATFISPTEGELFVEGADVRFQAIIGDVETPVDDLIVNWSSTRGGAITATTERDGSSVAVTLNALEAGDQTVTLQVIDERSQEGFDSVQIVIEENLPPSIDIISPAEGSEWSTGLPVVVETLMEDDHHNITETTLAWGGVAAGSPDAPVSPDGLGEANFSLGALPAGDYLLSVTATDPFDKELATSVSFTVINGDLDGDGHVGIDQGGDDCDDTDADIFPGNDEACNNIDDNCNGLSDEDLTITPWYFDGDNDGYGVTATLILDCAQPASYSSLPGDCDDLNNNVNPGELEVCDNVDNDCTAGVDDGLPQDTYYFDGDNDGFGVTTGFQTGCASPPNHVTEPGDCDDADVDVNPDAEEVCDGVDNDCAGGADDGFTQTPYYFDNDGDDYGLTSTQVTACAAPLGYTEMPGDCEDNDDQIYPGQPEICDDLDNDCDGTPDDGLPSTIYIEDLDEDGYGALTLVSLCYDPGVGWATVSGDCNEGDPDINPGKDEVCGNGIDEDCSGTPDDGTCIADYTGTWDITPTVNTSCTWLLGSFSNTFDSLRLDHAHPDLNVLTLANPDGSPSTGLDGSFTSSTDVMVSNIIGVEGCAFCVGFAEFYDITLDFTSDNTFTGFYEEDFESNSYNNSPCGYTRVDFTGTRR